MRKKTGAVIIKYWVPVIFAAVILTAGGGSYHCLRAENEKTYQSLKLFSDVLQELEENYVDEVDTEELIHSAIKGMVSSLDPHSTFMPPEAFDELQDDTKGEFGGIGIVITMKKGILTVISPIEGTPAYEAGIMAGDMIIRIDGESTSNMELWECVKKMRGPRGEEVVITILREGDKEPVDYTLKRDTIPMESVRSIIVEPGYGYVWVTNFRNNTSTEIKEALTKMESGDVPMKGLIMDLRNNPGGLLSQAAEVSDIFLDVGTIVSIKGRFEEQTEVFEAHDDDETRGYPLVVLINGGSASASEIVAGALQDHKRALIIGTTSFGKGSVQSVKPLKDGFGLKYTIARYYTPNGRSIQAQGIKPDIEVKFNIEPEAEEKKSDSPMTRMLRERDLKNHLMPEKTNVKKNDSNEMEQEDQKQTRELVSIDKLKRDSQVQRALDILIGYSIFMGNEQ